MSVTFAPHILASMTFLSQYWGWIISGLIVVLGLLIFGFSDVTRFSIKRAWAISGVCFDESIRKKVLWITPLAIAGVIVVSQLQRALDEQDAIRQTIKFCLFASGIVVVLSSIILACTNLPKEIENRVIFTIVTKPITRLELIFGKVLGFARVSATILIIMGLFTWGYLHIRERNQLHGITTRLQNGNVSETEKMRLDHYAKSGLLNARDLWGAREFQIFGAMPDFSTTTRAIQGDGDGDFVVPFKMDNAKLFPDGEDSGVGDLGLVIRMKLDWTRTGPVEDSPDPSDMPTTAPIFGPQLPSTQPQNLAPRSPGVTVDLCDDHFTTLIPGANLVGGVNRDQLLSRMQSWLRSHKEISRISASRIRLHDEGKPDYVYAWIPPTLAKNALYNITTAFGIRVMGANANVSYKVGAEPVHIYVPTLDHDHIVLDEPPATEIMAISDQQGNPVMPIFHGRLGIHQDQEIVGGTEPAETADYSFRNTPPPQLVNGQIPFEIGNLQIQRDNDSEEEREDPTTLMITIRDGQSKKLTAAKLSVETRQTAFFSVPADAITGPNYEVIIQCANRGHTVGFYPQSLQLVAGSETFAVNLIKSLAIIWLMSILVIILSIFCSTFVSWPIAIVLTVILLLGHWGVAELADTNAPGLGRQIAMDFKLTDVAVSKVVSSSVDQLSSALNAFAKVLPDTSNYDAIGDIEQGVTLSLWKLLLALEVTVGFGLPAIVLAYLILKYKEVAP